MSSNDRNLIKKVCDHFPNSRLNFITFSEEFDGIETTIEHISIITYYRLLLHKYIIDFDKCIWLDSDTIVCSDISELMTYKLKDNYIAGVKAPSCQLVNSDYNRERLSLPSINQYINAGVLLMNLKKLRNDKMENLFFELAPKKFEIQDQDVLNVACYDKIVHLHFKYNFQPSRLFESNENIFNVFPLSEIKEAYENPVIVHFLDKIKPWQDSSYDYKDNWFSNYTELTELFAEFKGFSIVGKNTIIDIDIDNIINAKKLVLYGAGHRGKDVLSFLRYLEIREPDEIWDRCFYNYADFDDVAVTTPKFNINNEQLKDITIVICIDNAQVIRDINKQSRETGITNVYNAINIKKALWNWLLLNIN